MRRGYTHSLAAAAAEPTWLQIARFNVGVRETQGPADNAQILGWARALGGWVASFYDHDAIPWCALFMAHIFFEDGKRIPAQVEVLRALSWRAWGQPLVHALPGAVCVFTREGGGHVGLYVAETADGSSYIILGGNQDDMVCYERISKYRCIAVRWPDEVEPFGEPVIWPGSDPGATKEA